MKHRTRQWGRAAALLVLGLTAGTMSGCSDLLDVKLPAQLTDDVLADPNNAGFLVNTFIAQWEDAWDKQVYWNYGREGGGEVHLCGPCGYSDYQPGSPVFGGGTPSATSPGGSGSMSKVIRFSTYVWDQLNKDWDVKKVPQRAQYMALADIYQGAALMWAGSLLCEVTIDGGKKQTPDETLSQAVTVLNRALTEITTDFPVTNGISTSARNMTTGLLAQTLYQQGKLTEAAAQAAKIPNGFIAYNTREGGDRMNFGYDSGTLGAYMEAYDPIDWWVGSKAGSGVVNPATNAAWPAVLPFTGWSNLGILANGRAVDDSGIPVRTAPGPTPWTNAIGVTAGAVADTRVPTRLVSIQGKGTNGVNPTKYTGDDSDEPLVNWKEMVLIRAEAVGGQAAIDLVNQIRTADKMPLVTYADPANATQIRYMIIEEKRRTLFEEGRFMYTMLRNLDVSWFPRNVGNTRFKSRPLQGGVRWIMTAGEYTDNPNLTLADKATGCAAAEKPVGNI